MAGRPVSVIYASYCADSKCVLGLFPDFEPIQCNVYTNKTQKYAIYYIPVYLQHAFVILYMKSCMIFSHGNKYSLCYTYINDFTFAIVEAAATFLSLKLLRHSLTLKVFFLIF